MGAGVADLAGFFFETFFTGALFTARVFPEVVFAAARLAGAFFAGAEAFTLGALDFLAAALVSATGVGTARLFPTRNASRSFTLAIQAGARPKPVHVFPVLGSRYLGTPAPARFGGAAFLSDALLEFALLLVADDEGAPRFSSVTPSEAINSLTLPTAAFISTLAARAYSDSSCAIFLRSAVSFDMAFLVVERKMIF